MGLAAVCLTFTHTYHSFIVKYSHTNPHTPSVSAENSKFSASENLCVGFSSMCPHLLMYD